MKNLYFILLFLINFYVHAQVPVLNPIVGPSSLCLTANAVLGFSVSASNAPTSYTWRVFPNTSITVVNAQSVNIHFPLPSFSTSYTILCIASNSAGTSVGELKSVNLYDTPTFSLTSSNQVCKGENFVEIKLDPITPNWANSNINWIPRQPLITSPNILRVVANLTLTTSFTITATKGPCTYSNQITMYVNECTGIDNNLAEKELPHVFPNPFSNKVILSNLKPGTLIMVNDLLGKNVFNFRSLNSFEEIDLSTLNAGVYYLQAEFENTTSVIKLIKE